MPKLEPHLKSRFPNPELLVIFSKISPLSSILMGLEVTNEHFSCSLNYISLSRLTELQLQHLIEKKLEAIFERRI